MIKHDDLMQDWPSDPENEELARLAGQLADSPGLPGDAMSRVEARLEKAMARHEQPRAWRRVAFGLSMAAAILIAIASFAYYRATDTDRPRTRLIQANAPSTPIDDRVSIAIQEPVPSTPSGRGVVRLDEYRSLYMD